MSYHCHKLQQEYKTLKSLKEEFDAAYLAWKEAKTPEEAKETILRVKELKAILEQKRDALREKLWPFESLPQKELEKQYENQREILLRNGILEQLSNGELGIKAIDGKEYVFPKYSEIIKEMRENKEMLKTKIEQGFNQLLIVPFGMKLDDLIEKYQQVIWKHYQEKKLFATMENPEDVPRFPDDLPFDQDIIDDIKAGKEYEELWHKRSDGLWAWEGYYNADVSDQMVYFPERFDRQNHRAKTKQQILQEQGGWNIIFIEDLPNIPGKNKGKEIHGRHQLEAGQSPHQYLETLKTNPRYQYETGMTPEEQIIYAISYLEKTNQVIDYFSSHLGNGVISFQLGAFFHTFGEAPISYWNRSTRQAYLDRRSPDSFGSHVGARSAVRVKFRT